MTRGGEERGNMERRADGVRRSDRRPNEPARRGGSERRGPEKGASKRKSKGRTHSRTAVIRNKRGLHARAAAKFVIEAGRFNAEISVSHNEMNVSGNSIMGLMMLAAGPECEIEIKASGPDAKKALDDLCALIEAKFNEE